MVQGRFRLLAVALLAGVVSSAGSARASEPGAEPRSRSRSGRSLVEARAAQAQARPAASASSWRARRGQFFQRNWGIDVVGVRCVSSGLMLRFDYRVVDPERAKVLTDRKTRPFLVDEATGTALAVPAMENIGELRQVAPLEARRTYFMIFGNPGGLVKPGSRVSLVMGSFRVDGLEVQ
ncbi:MAG TPA: hypothetical protein VGK67_07185 [Myxococcales bacterium]|jgi:hypothetical protein